MCEKKRAKVGVGRDVGLESGHLLQPGSGQWVLSGDNPLLSPALYLVLPSEGA